MAYAKKVEALARQEGNDFCADCNEPDPTWVSINIGVFICVRCSGVHRSMGAHISKVRSLELDTDCWDEEMYEFLKSRGNTWNNAKYESIVPQYYLRSSTASESDMLRDNWIRAKYERKDFINEAERDKDSTSYHVGAQTLTDARFDMPEHSRIFYFEKLSPTSRNKWQNRVFTCVGPYLGYYRKVSDSYPAGLIPLRGSRLAFPPDPYKIPRKIFFKIKVPTRDYELMLQIGPDTFNILHTLQRAIMYYSKAKNQQEVNLNPSSAEPREYEVIKEGYLSKQGGESQNWRRRYFVLIKDNQNHVRLFYFKRQSAYKNAAKKKQLCSRSKGEVPLTYAGVFPAELKTMKPYTFHILTMKRSYFMQAVNEQELTEWMDALRHVFESSEDHTRETVNFLKFTNK